MTDDNAWSGLAALEFDEGWLEAFQALDDEAVSPGRVGRVDKGAVDVHLTSGVVRATPYDSVATGDWVGARQLPEGRWVVDQASGVVRP